MTGLTNYSADAFLNWLSGLEPVPALGSRFLALFTGVGTDAGTGFTEVSGSGYARVQVAGSITTNAGTTTSSAIIQSGSAIPSWVASGMSIYDVTTGFVVGTVLSVAGDDITMAANSAHAIGSGDTLNISIFPAASGTAPSTITSGAAVTFPTSTGDWTSAGASPVFAWGLFDALSSGNMVEWDYLGAFSWMPATVSSASPGVITAHAHGMANGNFFVVSTEIAGTLPSFSSGNYTGVLTAAGVTTDTLDVTGVNTSSTGDFMIRQVAEQLVPNNTQISFPSGSFVLGMA